MMNQSFISLKFAGFLLISGLLPGGITVARAEQILSVHLDTAERIKLKGQATDIIIANPTIADITLQSPNQFIIIAKQPGRTSLMIFDNQQRVLMNAMVVVTAGDTGLLSVLGPRGEDNFACDTRCTLIPGGHTAGAYGFGTTDAPVADKTDAKPTQEDAKTKQKQSSNGATTSLTTPKPIYVAPY